MIGLSTTTNKGGNISQANIFSGQRTDNRRGSVNIEVSRRPRPIFIPTSTAEEAMTTDSWALRLHRHADRIPTFSGRLIKGDEGLLGSVLFKANCCSRRSRATCPEEATTTCSCLERLNARSWKACSARAGCLKQAGAAVSRTSMRDMLPCMEKGVEKGVGTSGRAWWWL